MKPLFITFEGLDGSGKSTHVEAAVALLESTGQRVCATCEPGGTPLGEAIRAVFLDSRWDSMEGAVETLLIFASRRQHLLEIIDPALARGWHVLCDRFTDSTLAYQGYGRGVPRSTIEEVDRLATGGRRPDRTVLFDLPPERARDRGHSEKRRREPSGIDRLDAEDLAFYTRVREGYLEIARAESARFRIVDSSGSHADTERQVREALQDLLGARP